MARWRESPREGQYSFKICTLWYLGGAARQMILILIDFCWHSIIVQWLVNPHLGCHIPNLRTPWCQALLQAEELAGRWTSQDLVEVIEWLGGSGIQKPNAIVVNGQKGLTFWSRWGVPEGEQKMCLLLCWLLVQRMCRKLASSCHFTGFNSAVGFDFHFAVRRA